VKVHTEEETGKSADALNCEFITSVTIKTHRQQKYRVPATTAALFSTI